MKCDGVEVAKCEMQRAKSYDLRCGRVRRISQSALRAVSIKRKEKVAKYDL